MVNKYVLGLHVPVKYSFLMRVADSPQQLPRIQPYSRQRYQLVHLKLAVLLNPLCLLNQHCKRLWEQFRYNMQIAVAVLLSVRKEVSVHAQDIRMVSHLLKDFQLPILVPLINVNPLDCDHISVEQVLALKNHPKCPMSNDFFQFELLREGVLD